MNSKPPRDWIEELGLVENCSAYEILKLGDQFERIGILELDEDPLAAEVFQSGREAIEFLGQRLPAHELFIGLPRKGMACGVVYTPEEMIHDPHFVEHPVFHFGIYYEHLDASYEHPGAPYRFMALPWAAWSRCRYLGEHQALLDDVSCKNSVVSARSVA